MAGYFPSAASRLYIARQNSQPPPSSASLRPIASLRGAGVGSFATLRRHEGREGRGRADEGKHLITTAHDDTGFEPPHTSSPTDHLLAELQLYGHRPFQDEPDPRPLPEAQAVAGGVADIFDALIATLRDTRLEPDLDDLLWSAVNLFRRAVSRIDRSWMTMSRRSGVARRNRTARKFARSNSNASRQRVRR